MSEEIGKSKHLIEVKNLCKYFDVKKKKLHAVDKVDLTIDEGNTLGIVGESGCGKSTLGRTMLRLLEPTSGEIWFNGRDISKCSKSEMRHLRKEMQIIFQDPYSSINPRMTVADIIMQPMIVNSTYKTKTEMFNRVEELMDTVGLAKRIHDAYPHELDGGRRQRIGIARALALNPKFIVCDEPVSALDVSIQAQVVNMFEDLQKDLNLTYLFIAHDLSVVRHISNRIGVMYLGKLVELAEAYELISHSVHPYTKSLISAIPEADPIAARASKRIPLQGDVPSPLNPPSGCRFRTRCPYADEKCAEVCPEFKEVSPGHYAACHHLDKVN